MRRHFKEETNELELICVIFSSPPAQVDWYYQGQLLSHTENVISSFGDNYTLLLSNIHNDTISDEIECRAENPLGIASASSLLQEREVTATSEIIDREEDAETFAVNITNGDEKVENEVEIDSNWMDNNASDHDFSISSGIDRVELENDTTSQEKEKSADIDDHQGKVELTADDSFIEVDEILEVDMIIEDIVAENASVNMVQDTMPNLTTEVDSLPDSEPSVNSSSSRTGTPLVLSPSDSDKRTSYTLEWLVISPSEVTQANVKFRVDDPDQEEEKEWFYITANIKKEEPDVYVGKVVLQHLIPATRYRVHIATRNEHDYTSFSESFFFTTKDDEEPEEDQHDKVEEHEEQERHWEHDTHKYILLDEELLEVNEQENITFASEENIEEENIDGSGLLDTEVFVENVDGNSTTNVPIDQESHSYQLNQDLSEGHQIISRNLFVIIPIVLFIR